jgi:hypothetical protein
VLLIIISIFDGICKGGMLLLIYETSAELSYPVAESFSLGLILATSSFIRFIFNICFGFAFGYGGAGSKGALALEIIIMILCAGLMVIGIWAFHKSSFSLLR